MDLQPALVALPRSEALQLARRAAGARSIEWPADPGAISGVGGFRADITGQRGQERVAWATVDHNTGVLGLFADGRLLASADRNLGRVVRVQVISLPGLPHLALMVDDLVDQMVGAYLREERRRIYVWDGRGLREVFQGQLSSEQFEHAQWRNRRAPALWRLHRTLGDTALRDGNLTYTARHQELEAAGLPQAGIPAPGAFRLLSERREERRYRWNPRLRRFDQV
jgi:hypothetical protein